MAETPHTMRELATSGKPIAGFDRTTTGFWVVVSLVIHIALIGGTSVGFIKDTWIDPEGAAARQAEHDAKIAAEKAAAKAAKAPPTAPAHAPGSAAGASATKPATSTGDTSDEALMKAHGDAPVVKRSTEVSKPGEIPDKPDDLGISIEDTNKK